MVQAPFEIPKITPNVTTPMTAARWAPQAGPQNAAITCPVDIQFYGGARGGGKTDLVIGRQIQGAEKYAAAWNGLILRRKYKDFAEMRLRWDAFILAGLPAERIGGDQQTNFIKFKNGAKVTLTAIARLSEADTFQGQQFTQIDVDEAPAFAFLPGLLEKLKGCLRSPAGVPCHIGLTGNPGGPGSAAVKMLFMDTKVPYKVYGEDGSGQMTTVFIPSKVTDNKILCDADPKYVQRLMSIKDPVLRRAWLEGDWDAFIGQAIPFSVARHVIKPLPIPPGAPLYMTFDWGYGKPFSIGWWWVDHYGRLYRFAEWYGCSGIPDDGLRITDSKIKEGIIEREVKMGIWGRQIQRLAGHDCWNSKPNYEGGGQGPSTAEVFTRNPNPLYMTKADSKRELKLRSLREYMSVPENATALPMLVVYDTCTDFIRTIPSLCMDEDKPEDVDTLQEDHCIHGDTTVITDKGEIPIRELVGTTGRVLTVNGEWTQYHDCRLTMRQVNVVSVLFNDGRSLVCTEDHKLLKITGEWVEAKDLLDEGCHVTIMESKPRRHQSWKSSLSAKPHKNLTGRDIGCVENIFREKVLGFIEQCGNITMGLFRLVWTFTTKITTEAITTTTTWSTEAKQVMRHITPNNPIILSGSQLCTEEPMNGTRVTRVESGINNNTKSTAEDQSLKRQSGHASCAELYIKDCPSQNIVLGHVNNERGTSKIRSLSGLVLYVANSLRAMADTIKGHVPKNAGASSLGRQGIKPVRVSAAGIADVYCLDVDHASHAFAVCGGILVHNCYDEAAQLVMARPLSLEDEIPAQTEGEKIIEEIENDYIDQGMEELLGLGIGGSDFGSV